MRESLLKVALLAGVLAAAACAVYFFLLDSLSLNPFGKHKYIYIGIYALFFAGAFKIFRDKYNNRLLRVHQAIILGFLLNIIAASFLGLFTYLYLSFSGKEGNTYQAYVRDSLSLLERTKEDFTAHYSQQQYEQIVNEIRNLSMEDLSLDQAIGMFLIGFVLTFLFMLIFKN